MPDTFDFEPEASPAASPTAAVEEKAAASPPGAVAAGEEAGEASAGAGAKAADSSNGGVEQAAEPGLSEAATGGDAVMADASAEKAAEAGDGAKTDASAGGGSLSDRLKGRGLDMPAGAADATGAGGTTALTASALKAASRSDAAPDHAPLAVSAAEQKQLFTPLASQGAKALEAQKELRDENENETIARISKTLKRWVQECLVVEDKWKKLIAKGVLKCRVQARWSEGLDTKLKSLVSEYGAKLSVESEKEGAEKAPAWATAAELRQEKWMVGFDLAAFEKFTNAHPDTVDPPEEKVRAFIKEFIKSADLQTMKVKDLIEGLQVKFGKMRRPCLDRAKTIASDDILESQQPKKSGLQAQKPKVVMRKEAKSQIGKDEDVRWAEATLAPLGMREGSDDPVLRAPQAIALPILKGLKNLEEMNSFRTLLKNTKIGKVVNAYRNHPNSEVAKAAKDLVTSWRTAIQRSKSPKKSPKKVATEEPRGQGRPKKAKTQ